MIITKRAQKRIEQHLAMLEDPDNDKAWRAEDYLIRYYGARALEPLIVACDHPSPQVRLRAVWALAHTRDCRAFETVLRLALAPDKYVAYDAALGLGILGDLRAIEPLVGLMLTRDDDDAVGSAVAMGMVKLGKPAIPALLPLLTGQPNNIRRLAASVLGGIGGEELIAPLAALRSDTDPDLRIAANEALAEIHTPECRELLRGSLNDSDEWVRSNAARWDQDWDSEWFQR